MPRISTRFPASTSAVLAVAHPSASARRVWSASTAWPVGSVELGTPCWASPYEPRTSRRGGAEEQSPDEAGVAFDCRTGTVSRFDATAR